MQANDLFFVIPTYRLREVGEAIQQYDEHFWRNGHSVQMIVFDVGLAQLAHMFGRERVEGKVLATVVRA